MLISKSRPRLPFFLFFIVIENINHGFELFECLSRLLNTNDSYGLSFQKLHRFGCMTWLELDLEGNKPTLQGLAVYPAHYVQVKVAE